MITRRRVYVAVTILIFILGIAWLTIGHSSGQPLAYINGEPVIIDEFKVSLFNKRAVIYSYFKQKYNADDSRDFWTKNFDGEVPLDKIKKDALQDITLIKIQQIAAKQQGLLPDISYSSLLKGLKQENQRRKTALQKNEVIYGPEQYNAKEYYDLQQSHLKESLLNTFSQNNNISEKDLEAYYENHLVLYINEGAITIQKAAIAYPPTDTNKQKAADAAMKEIKEKLDLGSDFKQLVNSFNVNHAMKIVFGEQTMDQSSAKSDVMLLPALASAAYKLTDSKQSIIVAEEGSLYLIKLVKKAERSTTPFAQLKEGIRQQLLEGNYQTTIDEMVKKAQVKINMKVYNAIGESDIK